MRQASDLLDPRQKQRRSSAFGATKSVADSWNVRNLPGKEIDRLVNAFLNNRSEEQPEAPKKGNLQIVNAGSGNVDLLTHGAYKSLLNAGLVLADAGVAKDVLEVPTVDIVTLPGNGRISDFVVMGAMHVLDSGKNVVRLRSNVKDDDAELNVFRANGYSPVVIPSVFRPPSSPSSEGTVVSGPNSPGAFNESAVVFDEEGELTSLKLPRSLSSATIHELGAPRFITGEEAAAHVAYSLSDMSFVYPAYDGHLDGPAAILQQWAHDNVTNGDGLRQDVRVVSTTVGAGSVVHGAIVGGAAATALAPSSAIRAMIPTLHQIAAACRPFTLHVSARAIDAETYAVRRSLADVLPAAHAGFALLGSGSVQESHDFAVIAHVASIITRKPFAHFYDGVRTATESARAHVVDATTLAKIASEAADVFGDDLAATGVADSLEIVMEALGRHFGRSYRLFDYVGPKDAESVIVAVGTSGSLVESAITPQGNVGLLKVRLVRPWSARHFLAALPGSVKRLAVIDQTQAKAAQHGQGALFMDVTSAFYDAVWGKRRVPQVVSGDFGLGAEHFSQLAVEAFVKKLRLSAVGFGFRIETPKGQTPLKEEGVHEAIFWDSQSDDTERVGGSLAAHFDEHHDGSAQSFTVRSDVQIEPASATHLRYGPNVSPATAPHLVDSADVISVHNVALLHTYNVAASARHGAVLLLNRPGPVSTADLEREIPADVRQSIAKKHLKLHVIDGAKVASDFTLFSGKAADHVHLILRALFFHLAPGCDQSAGIASLVAEGERTEHHHSTLRNKIGSIHAALERVVRVDVPVSWAEHVEGAIAPLPVTIEPTLHFKKVHQRNDDDDEEVKPRAVKRHAAAFPVMFKEAYGLEKSLRPDVHEDTYVVKVTENVRLTPESYERNVFHIEMDIAGTGLKYEIGEALGVYGHNDEAEVKKFIEMYGLDAHQLIAYERKGEDGTRKTEHRTVEQLLVQVVDLFGKPGKKFYQSLCHHAADMSQREKLGWLGSAEGAEDLEKLAEEETPTFADVLEMFPSARPGIEDLLQLIPDIKPRHYSISSSMNVHPTSVHLLVVVVDWETKAGKKRQGQCTRYLNALRPGQSLTVSVKPSVMKLPKSHEAPVIMAGLGTGMAPFRAFVEERAYQKSLGKKVGPMSLYFGARHRSEEYLYGEELEAYHADGLLTHLRLAFSRDQKEKVYIQHKIKADAEILAEWMLRDEGAFYLCGPTWPVPDVRDALIKSFSKEMTVEEADHKLESFKEEERYILEVY
ncbi:hypothetical protein HK101_012014 [Irineochytrium annulatum]|nr:hypothetical protein HK101_012014 [Irineochytrium annulatum]